MNALFHSQGWRCKLSPKFIWLEPEHFEEAKKISASNTDEARQWQSYLNALALLGFEQWVKEKTSNINVNRENCLIFHSDSTNTTDVVCNFDLNDFKLCLIIVDDLIDDCVTLPEEVIESPKLAAHFYVLLEVLEEEEKLNIYGFLRHDQIVKYGQLINLKTHDGHRYILPLIGLDSELNNLLLSTRFLEAVAIPLPSAVLEHHRVIHTLNLAETAVNKIIVNLNDWLSGVFAAGWQSTETLWKTLPIDLDVGFARSVNKSNSYEVSGTKLFDFGLLINGENFALVVNQKKAANNEKDVLVQVLPGDQQYLPSGLSLRVTLNPNTYESESQEVTARKADNAIQLEFSESPGKLFQVEIRFNDAVVIEEFLL